ncbi:MAG: hypothetical protein ACR2PW_04235 [Gammaproteobacteria bacterium]
MDYWFLIVAAVISLGGMLFHGLAGHKVYIGAVNQTDLTPLAKSLSLVSWHVFTIFLFISACTLAYIAYNPQFAVAAYPIISINFLGSLLFILLGIGGHGVLLRMPGAYLMGLTALFAWLGV